MMMSEQNNGITLQKENNTNPSAATSTIPEANLSVTASAQPAANMKFCKYCGGQIPMDRLRKTGRAASGYRILAAASNSDKQRKQ